MKYTIVIEGKDKQGQKRIMVQETILNGSNLLSDVRSEVNCLGLHNFEIIPLKVMLIERNSQNLFNKILHEIEY